MGPSGCGKSTLLGLIAGLEAPTAGRVSIGGQEISSTVRARSAPGCAGTEFGLVFQSDNLLPFLTAAENVGLQLALRRRRERLSSAASSCSPSWGLPTTSTSFPISSRAGSASAWRSRVRSSTSPSVILADEPTGSLDADNSAVVIDLLLAAQRSWAPPWSSSPTTPGSPGGWTAPSSSRRAADRRSLAFRTPRAGVRA